MRIRGLSCNLLLPALALLASSSAWAAYDQTVTWADLSALDLAPAFRSQYGSSTNLFEPIIPESAFSLVLRDADGKMGKEFQIPPALQASVRFWLKIYTEYTTQQVVLFDGRHPEVVYEVLDFRDLAKTARNRVVYEVIATKRIKAAVKAYRATLRELAKNPNPASPSPYQKRVLSAVKRSKHLHPFAEMAHNIRSQTGQRDNIVKGLLAAEVFFPRMEQIFASYGVPPELTRLALVESSFNLKATSRTGASGIWQFMRNTALAYLKIDARRGIDERLSPLKSSVAAARLLGQNRKALGSWALAVTSYNHGLRGIHMRGEHDFAQISYLFDPCSKKSPLGWASRNYYAEFLAVLYAETYRNVFYGDPPASKMRSVVFHRLEKDRTAIAFATERGIPLQEFAFLNPDVQNVRATLPKGFTLAIPGNADNMVVLLKKAPKHASRLASPRA